MRWMNDGLGLGWRLDGKIVSLADFHFETLSRVTFNVIIDKTSFNLHINFSTCLIMWVDTLEQIYGLIVRLLYLSWTAIFPGTGQQTKIPALMIHDNSRDVLLFSLPTFFRRLSLLFFCIRICNCVFECFHCSLKRMNHDAQ